MMRLMSIWKGSVAALAVVALMATAEPAQTRADELVDLKVDSKPRKYDPQNPLQAEKQDFSISKPGVLTLVHVIDPVHKDAAGGYSVDEINLRNYVIGTTILPGADPGHGHPGAEADVQADSGCAVPARTR